jgi:hypothetical protein
MSILDTIASRVLPSAVESSQLGELSADGSTINGRHDAVDLAALFDVLAITRQATDWRISLASLLALGGVTDNDEVRAVLCRELAHPCDDLQAVRSERMLITGVLTALATRMGWRGGDPVPDYLVDDAGPLAV